MFGLKDAIIVALGGALGSVARYKLGGIVLHQTPTWNFPLSTFCVNFIGCLVIGVLAALVEHHELLSMSARTFLFTGVLGGFTTFSAFAYESVFLVRRGMTHTMLAYVMLSVLCGLAGVLVGMKMVDVLWPPHH